MLFVAQTPPPPPAVEIRLSSISTGAIHVARDGYVLVLGADQKGGAIVIFPGRPVQDGRVAAGTPVQLRSSRAATWVAVWSDRPFEPRRFTANTFWSTDSLRRAADGASVDALVGIARRMAGEEASIAYATSSAATPASFVLTRRGRLSVDVPFQRFNSRYLGPQEQWVRQGKFSGGPPGVCNANGTFCTESVWLQLGNMNLREPF